MRRTRKPDQKESVDSRWPRPKTLGEAREQIYRTFLENGWDERDRRVFAEMMGLQHKPLSEYDADELRTIRARMVAARMILE